jgi:hypothetical protein
MLENMSQRDQRAVKLGLIAAAAIIVIFFGLQWLRHWNLVRTGLETRRQDLAMINPEPAQKEGLLKIVPVFEMPIDEEDQKILFRNKLNEQLKKAGINSQPLEFVPASKKPVAPGYRLIGLKCSGKCQFNQALDLLSGLKANPYLVAIEEMSMKCDENNRQQVDLELTVSTLVKGSNRQDNKEPQK